MTRSERDFGNWDKHIDVAQAATEHLKDMFKKPEAPATYKIRVLNPMGDLVETFRADYWRVTETRLHIMLKDDKYDRCLASFPPTFAVLYVD